VDKIIEIVQALPEKHFRTLVLLGLVALFAAQAWQVRSLIRIEAYQSYLHGSFELPAGN